MSGCGLGRATSWAPTVSSRKRSRRNARTTPLTVPPRLVAIASRKRCVSACSTWSRSGAGRGPNQPIEGRVVDATCRPPRLLAEPALGAEHGVVQLIRGHEVGAPRPFLVQGWPAEALEHGVVVGDVGVSGVEQDTV